MRALLNRFNRNNSGLFTVAKDKERITKALLENPETEIEDLIRPIKPKTSITEFFARQLAKLSDLAINQLK